MDISRRTLLLGGIGLTATAAAGAVGLPASAKVAPPEGGSVSIGPKNWMAAIPGGTSLAAMTLPGTHDTCALRRLPYVRCQSYGPHDQEEMGVRVLDLRVNDWDDMPITHGPIDVENTLVHVLDDLKKFLSENPTETVLISVKQEHTGSDAKKLGARWASTTKKYGSLLYTSSKVPTLDQVRGKVVVISRSAGIPGIPWSSAKVSDDYQVDSKNDAINKKWPSITKSLDAASKAPKSELHVTFCSGNGGTHVGLMPNEVNDIIEPRLTDWLNKRPGQKNERLGIVMVDYAKKGKIEQIASRNFGRNHWN